MPSIPTMATWALIGIVVFCAWVLTGMLIGMWLGRASKRYRRPPNDSPYERRWREDDGDDP